MPITLASAQPIELKPRITVIGVGGAGGQLRQDGGQETLMHRAG